MSARGIRRGDWFPGAGKSDDCYCLLRLAGTEEVIYKTGVLQHDRVDPVWNEEVEIPDYPVGVGLELSVWDSLPEGMKVPDGSCTRMVGRVVLQGDMFEGHGFNGELPLENLGKNVSSAFLNLKVKPDMQEYPEGPVPEFLVTFARDPKTNIGLDFDTQDDELVYIADVKPGPVQFHNLNAKPTDQVRQGHFIVQANGVRGFSANIVEVLKSDRRLQLIVRRPYEMTVAIRKLTQKTSLGMEFMPKVSGASAHGGLLVVDITDGPIFEWNLTNPDQEVRCGDRITAVNGQHSKASDLLKKMKGLEQFQMTVVRPMPVV
eukprot:CAMPEP_0175366638 /NCGR_PEP_ID=MMETSP0095-20121207/19240_1 /TAXON_ID=311494 /ORGANISM="Alexandrium monilatum, Strain CCMP3105" /LENGTH=317 /DNA_ID=CAMNT_0016664651 /DNA_START=175 /DNA_END=1128 /DNA_ORIENTATION=+